MPAITVQCSKSSPPGTLTSWDKSRVFGFGDRPDDAYQSISVQPRQPTRICSAVSGKFTRHIPPGGAPLTLCARAAVWFTKGLRRSITCRRGSRAKHSITHCCNAVSKALRPYEYSEELHCLLNGRHPRLGIHYRMDPSLSPGSPVGPSANAGSGRRVKAQVAHCSTCFQACSLRLWLIQIVILTR